ncbi:MAG: DMT family transporter [Halanaeroarchaeum sp.]
MSIRSDAFSPRVTGLAFLVLAAIWGAAFVAIEIGLHHFPPLTFAGLRYLLAGAIVLGYARLTTEYVLPRNRRDLLRIAVLAVFFIFGNHAFLYLAEQYVSGAIAAVVVSFSPVLTAVFASLVLGDASLGRRELVGFIAGIAGVVIIAQPTPDSFAVANLLGIGLVFVAAVSFALGAVLSHPIPTTIPLASLQGWSMLTGATMLVIGGRLRGEAIAAIEPTPTAVLSFVYLTFVSGAFAFLLYFTLLDQVGPARLNLVGYLEPVAATLVGWALLGELVGPATVAGFGFILLGFALVNAESISSRFGVAVPTGAGIRRFLTRRYFVAGVASGHDDDLLRGHRRG